jgi:Spy/CpxP family protein refolding chaperone
MIRFCKRAVPHLVLASLLAATVALVGCAAHSEYRVYDPDDGTYHYWNRSEAGYYNQWEHDTHRHHRDYRKRSQDEQRQYWQWRANHRGHDQNRDDDRH